MEKTTSPKRKTERHRRTIALELFKKWHELERKGDSTALAKLLSVSKPTIDKALIYGCVHQQAIVDGITTYFTARIQSEKAQAEQLGAIQNTSAPAGHP